MSENFLKEEFIGMPVKILSSRDKTLECIRGEIIDETKHMFMIRTSRGVKKVSKAINTFEIDDKTVNGKKINYRPHDRIRKIK